MPKVKKAVKKAVVKKVAGKVKKVKIETVTEPVIEVKVDIVLPPESPGKAEPIAKLNFANIRFGGAKVLKILPTKETKTAFNCQMSDGTSRHVPKELFE